MTLPLPYRADQELPPIELDWADGDDQPYAFDTGWTAEVRICLASAPSAMLVSKTAGITLDDTFPNYVFEFSAGDWSGLDTPPETGTLYVCHVYCTRDADSKADVFRPDKPIQILLLPAVA